jgi:hypothetical protein
LAAADAHAFTLVARQISKPYIVVELIGKTQIWKAAPALGAAN